MAGILDKLPESLPLKRYGYQVIRHPNPGLYGGLRERFRAFLQLGLENFLGRTLDGFHLETYHQTLEINGIGNHSFVQKFKRNLPEEWLYEDPYIKQLLITVSEFTNQELRFYRNRLEFRVCRPHHDDNNPWHRDHWFPYFEPLLNIYLPMAGSYVDSSLQMVPGSHKWTDEEVQPTFGYAESKTQKNGVLYSVPEVKFCKYEIKGHRPDVVPGDFVLFSPKCVHGAGNNSSPETRFSFEFRLEAVS